MQFSSTSPTGHKAWGVLEAIAVLLIVGAIIYSIKDAVFIIISMIFLLIYAVSKVYGGAKRAPTS